MLDPLSIHFVDFVIFRLCYVFSAIFHILRQEWTDEMLLWDPDEYNNIRSIRIPAKNVWLPDTFIYNK